ncbi:MAG: hypothetical protein NZ534_10965, partial [Bacteroidia bacterium]|nr:hypothetical protein [Bacteroidia bacterium]
IFGYPLRVPLHEVYQAALSHSERCRNLGQASFGRYSNFAIYNAAVVGGVPLDEFLESTRPIAAYYRMLRDELYFHAAKIMQTFCRILMGIPPDYVLPPRPREGKKQNIITLESFVLSVDVELSLFEIQDADVDYENILSRIEGQRNVYVATTVGYEFDFAEAILRMRLEERTRRPHGAAKAFKKALKRFEQLAEVHPENWGGRYRLLLAEKARFSGDFAAAEI